MDKPMTGRLNKAKELKDARVKVLRQVLSDGREASRSLPDLEMSLKGLQAYELTNRVSGLDKPEEGEDTTDMLQIKIDRAHSAILAAESAWKELGAIKRFYRAYHFVVNGPKIRELKRQLTDAELWVEQWESRLATIDLDYEDDTDKRDSEKARLVCECEYAHNKVRKLQNQIAELCNIRYM